MKTITSGYLTLSVPLLTRLLEYAREKSPSDIDLHLILERIIDNGIDNVLSMEDYLMLVPQDEPEEKDED